MSTQGWQVLPPALTEAVGEATSGDGRVRATAAHGRLTAVDINSKAKRLPAKDLGDLVVTAVNAALDKSRPVRVPSDAGDPSHKTGLPQMEALTQAINEALGRIG